MAKRNNNPSCPFCEDGQPMQEETRGDESDQDGRRAYGRKREYKCRTGHKFVTVEVLRPSRPILVNKRPKVGSEPQQHFSIPKLTASIHSAATVEHTEARCTRLAYEVFREIEKYLKGKKRVIESREIGDFVLRVLAKNGEVSTWIRFTLVFHKIDQAQGPSFAGALKMLVEQWEKDQKWNLERTHKLIETEARKEGSNKDGRSAAT
jgi:transcriptional regulator NrdR family protein